MMRYATRVEALRELLPGAGITALLVTNLTNVRYLCGFSGTNGQMIVTEERTYLLTDPRYAARAGSLVQGAEILIYPDKLTDRLPEVLPPGPIGVEATTMTVQEHSTLRSKLEDRSLVSTSGLVEGLRRVKDEDEVAAIRRAVEISDAAFRAVSSGLSPGMTEREIALELELHMRRAGADGASFDLIVGSGPLSAHIHHSPSDRAVEKGDLVLLDLGATVDGYCSDLTRTVVLGPASPEQRDIYRLVLEAQTAAIQAVTPNAPGRDVDGAARRVIHGAGHEGRFGHGTGHGVGLDIHEAPRLHLNSEDTLRRGDVVTVEPGIYVPGEGGVRIEDCVLVTESGREVLGSAPKDELIEL